MHGFSRTLTSAERGVVAAVGAWACTCAPVRGETPIPNFSNSSFAIRSSPHSGFSSAILRISVRSYSGIGGRPGRDFSRQNNRQPARCQRSKAAGFTAIKAPRHSKSFANTTKLTRVAASTCRGLAPRSMN